VQKWLHIFKFWSYEGNPNFFKTVSYIVSILESNILLQEYFQW
jgi:hypothetical protein